MTGVSLFEKHVFFSDENCKTNNLKIFEIFFESILGLEFLIF